MEHETECGERRKLGEHPPGGYSRLATSIRQSCFPCKKEEEDQDGSVQEKEVESLFEDIPGVQKLYFHDGLDAEMPDTLSGYEDAAPVSTEPSTVQPDTYDSMDAEMSDVHGRGDTGPEPGTPDDDPRLLHALRPFDAEVRPDAEPPQGTWQLLFQNLDVELAVERSEVKRWQGESFALRNLLAEAHAHLNKLKDGDVGLLYETLREAWKEIKDLKDHKFRLENEVRSLTWNNNDLRAKLEEALAKRSSAAKADPAVQAICNEMRGLQLENIELQDFVARQVERNDAQAANDSQSADTRPPAKSLKGGFGIGDVVYVACEYWGLLGKHPKGYDHTTRFVIVNRGFQPGCWDLSATKHICKQPREAIEHWLPKNSSGFMKQQMSLQMLYANGHLGDVPGLLLSARLPRPASMSERNVYIDLTVNTAQTVVQTGAVH